MNLTKAALKKLTASDLTLFAVHYRHPDNRSKQKAINLNSEIFVDCFFPALADRFDELHFPVNIIGPGAAEAHVLSRKALRSVGAKNWRLNGELIYNPEEARERYDPLVPGDLALFAFEGEAKPEAVWLILISQQLDPLLHQALIQETQFVGRHTMAIIGSDSLRSLMGNTYTAYPQGEHPIELLMANESVEEAIYGSSNSQVRTADTDGRGCAISPESVQRQTVQAAKNGLAGEEVFEEFLEASGINYVRTSLTHARAAFDFLLSESPWENVGQCWIDVKSTTAATMTAFHMSYAELRFAARTPSYRIARVHLGPEGGSPTNVQILSGIHELASKLLTVLEELPPGTSVDSMEIHPSLLQAVTQQMPIPEQANWID